MTAAVPALQELARLVDDEPRSALRRMLILVCEILAMDVAYVSVLDGAGNRTVRQTVFADGTFGPADFTEPLHATWCGPVVARGALLVSDARTDAALMALPSTSAFKIVSYAGVPLLDEDGTVFGTLCSLGHTPHRSLNERDHHVLVGLAEVVAPLVRALDAPHAPSRAGTGLAEVAKAVEDAHDVEHMSRPLLAAVCDLTGMASAYLTVVHEEDGVQEIRYSHNTREGFDLPEGLLVPWDDTLCKRAIDEGRPCTTNVPEAWGDSGAARSLDIHVYISVPVEAPDGKLWGTLCAADSVATEGVEAHLPTMRLFARLIAAEVERESAAQRTPLDTDTDALTRCASRRAVQPWLFHQLNDLSPDEVVLGIYVEVGDLARINDTFGRAAGDAVLVEVGHRLRAAARAGDLVARHSGNEFFVGARVPRCAAMPVAARVRNSLQFSVPWHGSSVQVQGSVGLALSDGHDGPSLVAAADEAMHGIKRRP